MAKKEKYLGAIKRARAGEIIGFWYQGGKKNFLPFKCILCRRDRIDVSDLKEELKSQLVIYYYLAPDKHITYVPPNASDEEIAEWLELREFEFDSGSVQE